MLVEKNWTLDTYTNATWTDFITEEGTIVTLVITNTGGSAATVGIRLVDSLDSLLATILSAQPIAAGESFFLDIRSLNITADQKLQIQADVAGAEFMASGVSKTGTGPAAGGVTFDKAQVIRDATLAISAATPTKITWESTNFDTNTVFDAANDRFIPKKEGYYTVNGYAQYSASGDLKLRLYKNGAEYRQIGRDRNTALAVNGSILVYCNGTTDYLELFFEADSAGSLSLSQFDVVGPF